MFSSSVDRKLLAPVALAGALLAAIACGGETVTEIVKETVIVQETVISEVTVVTAPTQAPTTTPPDGPQGRVIVANGPLAGYPQAADNGYGHTAVVEEVNSLARGTKRVGSSLQP